MITYIYGAMNAGKTAQAIMIAHSLKKQSKRVKFYKVEPNRNNVVEAKVSSKTGLSTDGTLIGPSYRFQDYLMLHHKDTDVIIIDECQFLTSDQVEYLAYSHKEIIFVGLKVSYLARIFEGSQKILSFSPKEVEIPSYCSALGCTEHATHHLLEIDGVVIKDGPDKIVGDVDGERIKYSPVCKMHYLFKVVSKDEILEDKKCV